jgi:late competence protein required for DNA uptake (superfamily II DNA/RNA helicase)
VLGGMKQDEQERVLGEFRAGTVQVLLATCIGEEGLDVPQVGHRNTAVLDCGGLHPGGGGSLEVLGVVVSGRAGQDRGVAFPGRRMPAT